MIFEKFSSYLKTITTLTLLGTTFQLLGCFSNKTPEFKIGNKNNTPSSMLLGQTLEAKSRFSPVENVQALDGVWSLYDCEKSIKNLTYTFVNGEATLEEIVFLEPGCQKISHITTRKGAFSIQTSQEHPDYSNFDLTQNSLTITPKTVSSALRLTELCPGMSFKVDMETNAAGQVCGTTSARLLPENNSKLHTIVKLIDVETQPTILFGSQQKSNDDPMGTLTSERRPASIDPFFRLLKIK